MKQPVVVGGGPSGEEEEEEDAAAATDGEGDAAAAAAAVVVVVVVEDLGKTFTFQVKFDGKTGNALFLPTRRRGRRRYPRIC